MDTLYHIGFGSSDLGGAGQQPTTALLSGDPGRARHIAETQLTDVRVLSENRGLNSYVGYLPTGEPLLSCTSGMGGPSLSIILNELVQVGVETVVRVGTSGSIQDHVRGGSVVISSGALCRQGAAHDVAPRDYPAVANPFLTVRLAETAERLGVEHHVGLTASVDTFYEGQGRTEGANAHLLRKHEGVIEEYRALNILNFEMEAGTLFKLASVYGIRAACICAVIAQRGDSEAIITERKDAAVDNAIRVAVFALSQLDDRPG